MKRKSSHDQVTSSEATNGTPKRSRIVTDGWRSWEVGQVRDFLVNHDIDLEVVSAFVGKYVTSLKRMIPLIRTKDSN